MMLVFVGEPPKKRNHAAHLNGIKTDNRIENLMWASAKLNYAHAVIHGDVERQFTYEEAEEIRKRIRSGEKGRHIAKDLGVHEATISAIKLRRTYAHSPHSVKT